MARLSRKLRVCKWVGTVGCVLIVAAFVVSGWYRLSLELDWDTWDSQYRCHRMREFGLGYGRAYFEYKRARDAFPGASRWSLDPQVRPRLRLSTSTLLPAIKDDRDGDWRVELPLWLPFLILLIPTLLLWRRDWRKPRSGCCPRCDYDLTGNTTGRCPECGTPCESGEDSEKRDREEGTAVLQKVPPQEMESTNDRQPPDWVISARQLAVCAAIILVFVIASECFDPLTRAKRARGMDIIERQAGVSIILWLALCMAAGWWRVVRKDPPSRVAAAWPLVVPPVLLGTVWAARTAWGIYTFRSDPAMRFAKPLSIEWLDAILIIYPLGAGAVAGIVLFLFSCFWRQRDRPKAGTCEKCGYNLFGNTTGRCPECGTLFQPAMDGGPPRAG